MLRVFNSKYVTFCEFHLSSNAKWYNRNQLKLKTNLQSSRHQSVVAPKLFDCLTTEQYEAFCKKGRKITLQAGALLFQQGDPVEYCFTVIHGRLKLTKLGEDGKEVIIRYISENEVTAAVTVLKDAVYPVTAESVGESEIVAWNKRSLTELMYNFPNISINLLNVAFDRLDDIQQRYLELCTEQVDQRVARSLLRFMTRSGVKTDQGIEINIPLSRQNIADYSGTTLHTVSRTLSSWEKIGWVKSGRQHIVITNPHELVMFAENGKAQLFPKNR